MTTYIDYKARLYYNIPILAQLGRVLEPHLNAERGVASRGGDSQQNRHGGAPGGERLRETQGAWPAASRAGPRVPRKHPTTLGAPPPLKFGVAKPKFQTPGAKTRRGNEGVLSGVNSVSSSFRPSRDSGEGRNP